MLPLKVNEGVVCPQHFSNAAAPIVLAFRFNFSLKPVIIVLWREKCEIHVQCFERGVMMISSTACGEC